ncbi:MAG: AMP-binding protein, partial [Bacteroidota bacterium]
TTQISHIIGIAELDLVSTLAWEGLDSQLTDFHPPFPILENDLAYILYTSGSTGNPKGIMHTHSSGLNYARLTADLYQITEADVIGNHAPIFFDISTLGYFTAPLVGACTVIASDAHTIFPESLSQLIEKEQVTIWYSVPLALIQMVQNGALHGRNMHALRWVLYAGEPFPPKHLRSLMNIWTTTQFSNVYGPTELNQCTFYTIPRPLLVEEAIPIGKVWGNTEKVILDETDREVTTAETPGELCVRSGTMMKGYWQQPTLTEKSFYKRRNNVGFNDIFYRTGDLVQLDQNGLLHFLGRKDHQIKIRGYRVELSGIESTLINHDAVAEAAVFPIKEDGKIVRIAAAVILKPTVDLAARELRTYLKGRLPSYAVPESISIVASFPRTSTGKIKRLALAENIRY